MSRHKPDAHRWNTSFRFMTAALTFFFAVILEDNTPLRKDRTSKFDSKEIFHDRLEYAF